MDQYTTPYQNGYNYFDARPSRACSTASINELTGIEEDKSLERAGDVIRLEKCEDETFIKNAFRYCGRCLKGSWANCPPNEFDVKYISGGLTNYLYLCSLPDDMQLLPNEPRKVLIRIHGSIIDKKQRFYEGVIFTLLSERGIGPKTHGVFYSGRIEEYIPSRHLYTRELADPHISKMIARRAAQYHTYKLPLSKEPKFLWENIEKYLSMIRDIKFKEIEKIELFEKLKNTIDFQTEYEWLRMMLLQLNSPIVFCHNDMQEGNILYDVNNKEETDIILIDYDYSSYNFRGFDIGNHFCEWMYEYRDDFDKGYKVYHDGYPTEEQQIHYANEYLNAQKEIKTKMMNGELDLAKYMSDIPLCSVETLLNEANNFALASHFFWFLWSIVQEHVSKIEFGYLEYANARLDTYLKQKEQLGHTTKDA